jgi:hypothetical protein
VKFGRFDFVRVSDYSYRTRAEHADAFRHCGAVLRVSALTELVRLKSWCVCVAEHFGTVQVATISAIRAR